AGASGCETVQLEGGDGGIVQGAELAITTVPAGAACIEVSVTGASTFTKQFAVAPGDQSVTLPLGNIAPGNVTLTGRAFDVACGMSTGATASWIADPAQATIQIGVVPSLTLTFRANNSASVTANFVGNIARLTVTTSALIAVMADGTVRASGLVPYLYNAPAF